MPPIDLDRLLADTAFVRRIARSLVRDPDAAEDLAQDALVVALERPPRAGTSLRGWIATVVRTLAVDRARSTNARARREASAAQAEHAPGPDEIATRLDLSQRVASALRELEDPYRTALYLRYVEELDPPAIAARLGLPVATVKTQLRRGLEMLRRRFDREWGGREAWSAALVPWIADPARSAPIVETLIVSTTTKIAAALLVCGVAAWVLWPESERLPLADAPSIASATDAGLAAPAGGDAPRAAVAALPDGSAAVPGTDRTAPKTGPFVRVLDERRFPVPGAHVVLHVPGFGDDETTTDADGIATFVQLPGLGTEKRAASLLAWEDGGRAAARVCTVKAVDASMAASAAAKALALGEIVLGPGGSLAVRVEADGVPAAGARVVLQVGAMRTIILETAAGPDGRARFEHLPARPVHVRATSEASEGRVETVVARGRETDLVVVLQPVRTVEVRVVDAESKKPIRGARVAVSEMIQVTGEVDDLDAGMAGRSFVTMQTLAAEIAPTDARGCTRVSGIPRQGKFEVGAQADGWFGREAPAPATRIPADVDSVTLELTSLHARSARWPLEPGEVAPPPDGTELALRRETVLRHALERYSPPPTRAWMDRGEIRAEGVLDKIYGCYAIAPDGSLARLWIEDAAEVGHATSFRRPRRVDVRILDAEGRAAPGVPLEIVNEGNNLLLPVVETDPEGRAAFEGLWGRRAKVQSRGIAIGTVDLDLGDAHVEGRVPSTRELSVRLRIDGQPRLPPVYRIYIGRGARVVSEDPASGVVRVAFEASGDTAIRVTSAGFLPASLPSVSDTTDVVQFDLVRAGALLAHVEPPRTGRVRVRAEAWDEEQQRWKTTTSHGVQDERFAPNAPDGAYLFEGLEPGRWRVRDVDAEVASDTVDVVAGAPPPEVALDLSGIVRVKGVVEVPDGTPATLAHVVVEGEGVASHQNSWVRGTAFEVGHYVDEDGRFELSIDATRPVTLRAVHPYLSPDPELGSVVVRGGETDVRLKVVSGDEVQIPVAAFVERWPRESLRVYAYPGEPVGEPHAWFCARVVDGVARFSGLAHGTWTLWIDPERTYAPTVLRDVRVGAGITRVEAAPVRGSALRVRVLHAEGTATPRIYVSVQRKAEPMLVRSINSSAEELVVLSGIGAGTYAVGISEIGGPQTARTIEFDGLTDVDIDFDAREPAPR